MNRDGSVSDDLTGLLRAWREGDTGARDRLIGFLHDDLRAVAEGQLRRERPDHTLQATALVNEAYLRLVDADVAWQDRAHFLAVTSRVMRRVLVDYARGRNREKRGGGAQPIRLEDAQGIQGAAQPGPDILDLNDALEQLSALDERKGQIVELHYFGGLSQKETAEVVGVSEATVERDLKFAKAWLRSALS